MLAIVIPYYKLTFFESTLQSLADQTLQRFKVYIGDDCSPENPISVLEKFKKKLDFSYHKFETNRGGTSLVEQWERCVSLTNDEEWIMILGDDDYLGKTVVELFYKQYPIFVKKTNVIRFSSKIVNEKLQNISKSHFHPLWEKATDSYFRRFKGETRSSLSEHIFSRNAYDIYKFKNYPLAWHSDDQAWLDFSEKLPIYTINEGTIFIRLSNINISGKNDNEESKNSATALFFKNILKNKLYYFSKNQQLELIFSFEVFTKRVRKLNNKEWFFLIYLYFVNFKFLLLIKCIRRFFISIFSR